MWKTALRFVHLRFVPSFNTSWTFTFFNQKLQAFLYWISFKSTDKLMIIVQKTRFLLFFSTNNNPIIKNRISLAKDRLLYTASTPLVLKVKTLTILVQCSLSYSFSMFFLFPLKMSENQRFSNVYRRYRNGKFG